MRNLPIQRRENDRGFTLIELMVVVLIIAILLAIAIPTFLGAQNKAKDRSAQSSARNALTNAKTIFADGGDYTKATGDAALNAVTGTLGASEPSLKFVQAVDLFSTGPKVVSVLTTTDKNVWYAAVLSDTNTCFYIADNLGAATAPLAGTSYGKDTGSSSTTCIATASPAGGYTAKW